MTSDGGMNIALPPGLLDVDQSVYHNDQVADQPTLSKSIIQLLIEKSPAHARHAHPRLNPDFTREEDDKYAVGTVAHQLFLEGNESGLCVAPFDDWRTAAAKTLREEARAAGLTPLLAKQAEEARAMVAALREQCDRFDVDPPLFADGTAERTIVWEDEFGVLCRARLDFLRDDFRACDDLKTTKASANPEAWTRTLFGIGADVQAAFYGRGMRAVLGVDPVFRFVVVECAPPFAMSVVSLAPDTLALAEKKVSYALRLWATCLRNGEWPGYSDRVAYATTPVWLENAWLEREVREVEAA